MGTDRVEVVALVAPPPASSPSPTSSPSGSPGQPGPSVTVSGSSTVATASPSDSASASRPPSAPALEPDGFPISAPLRPLWWNGQVVGLGPDATVVGYQPGSGKASLLDLGAEDLRSIAELP